jgi:hypothetical protein
MVISHHGSPMMAGPGTTFPVCSSFTPTLLLVSERFAVVASEAMRDIDVDHEVFSPDL